MSKYVADIETIINFFLLVAKDLKTKEIHVFRFWYNPDNPKGDDRVDDTFALIKFLAQAKGFVTFNGLRFDSILIEFFVRQSEWFESNYLAGNTKTTVDMLYAKAQELISSQERDEAYAVNESSLTHSHLDLFAIYHFANKGKRASLKDVQVNIGWPNVLDMFWPHGRYIPWNKAQEVIDYCINDVESTEALYNKSGSIIKLRSTLSKKWHTNLMNADDPKIGATIILKELVKATGIPEGILKTQRTFRKSIDFSKIILPQIQFGSVRFNEVLDKFSSTIVTGTKGEFAFETEIDGVQYSFAQGGLHGTVKPGIYEEDEDYGIMDVDGKSFYPKLAIENKWFPAHIGPVFCDVLQNLYDIRAATPKSDPVNYGLKISLNGVIGQSNSLYSPLLDSLMFMQITINGQLSLMMLVEMLTSFVQVLQANTDGITFRYKRRYLPMILAICKKWESIMKIELENNDYKKICIVDVNNYIAQYTNGEYKAIGQFEFEHLKYHKNNSFLVVPMALKAYLLDGIDYKHFVIAHTNFLDFCGKCKCNKDSHSYYQVIEKGEVKTFRQQKTLRFYVAKKGAQLVKSYTSGKSMGTKSLFIKGYKTIPYNKHNLLYVNEHFSNLNLEFYYTQIEKVLEILQPGKIKNESQLQLF